MDPFLFTTSSTTGSPAKKIYPTLNAEIWKYYETISNKIFTVVKKIYCLLLEEFEN